MFCPCARSYFMVEGLQTEKPRLVRSRLQEVPASSSRAPLPKQIRSQSARGDSQRREHEQAQEFTSYRRQGPHVRSRPVYDPRGYGRPRGIMKIPTDEFPFAYDTLRQPRTIQRSKTDEKSRTIRVEVGRSSSPSPSPDAPASDVVKIRVYRRDGSMTPLRGEGDIVVRDTRAEALRTNHTEQTQGWEFTGEPQW
ncbi:hypothetical protein BJX76DRAFT_349096 [Aspergillus varians]